MTLAVGGGIKTPNSIVNTLLNTNELESELLKTNKVVKWLEMNLDKLD